MNNIENLPGPSIVFEPSLVFEPLNFKRTKFNFCLLVDELLNEMCDNKYKTQMFALYCVHITLKYIQKMAFFPFKHALTSLRSTYIFLFIENNLNYSKILTLLLLQLICICVPFLDIFTRLSVLAYNNKQHTVYCWVNKTISVISPFLGCLL